MYGSAHPQAMRFLRAPKHHLTCSTIWPGVRLPYKPMRPVKQNWQFMAQPTWLDTQSVMRPLPPCSRTMGIKTVSTCIEH